MTDPAALGSEPKVDCHCHVFDPTRFPYDPANPYHPAGQEIGTAAQIARVFAANGVRHALLVQPNSGYGTDNRAMLDAIAASGGAWRGVALVPFDVGLDDLASLRAAGVVGVTTAAACSGRRRDGFSASHLVRGCRSSGSTSIAVPKPAAAALSNVTRRSETDLRSEERQSFPRGGGVPASVVQAAE